MTSSDSLTSKNLAQTQIELMPIVIAKAINSDHDENSSYCLPKKLKYQFSIYHSEIFLHHVSGKVTKEFCC
jgi:hypothetical protein